MDPRDKPTTPSGTTGTLTSKLQRQYQELLDWSSPYVLYRWVGTGVALVIFLLRIFLAQGWYLLAYILGVYLLYLFLAFRQPKIDPPNDALDNDIEDGAAGALPTKQDEGSRPFIQPEFKIWHSATRAVLVSFVCSWFEVFNVPVFWPTLAVYWFLMFVWTMRKLHLGLFRLLFPLGSGH